MSYTIFEVSKELNINTATLYKEIEKADFKDYIYQIEGTMYLKEDGIQKLLEKIDTKEIYFKSSIEYEREISLLRRELMQHEKENEFLKRELEKKKIENQILEKKISELAIIEKRVVDVEEKVVSNMRANLIKRSERNKKKKWF